MNRNRLLEDANGVGTTSPAVMRAVARVLRPLVRLLLDHGVTLPTLEEMLKAAYVTVAREQFGTADREPNDGRVSVLTGIHRKDVRRLRGTPSSDSPPPMSITVGGQIILQWISRPEFLDSRKRVRHLPRLRRDGGAVSFEALAESVSKDVGPRAILDELLRLGIVHIDNDDRVCLETSAFVPRKGLEEKAYYFGKNIHDHLAAVAHNLRGEIPPRLERSVNYVDLSQESIEYLAKTAEQAGMGALTKISRKAQDLKQRDQRKKQGGQEFTFGVYFHTAPNGSESLSARSFESAAPEEIRPQIKRRNTQSQPSRNL